MKNKIKELEAKKAKNLADALELVSFYGEQLVKQNKIINDLREQLREKERLH